MKGIYIASRASTKPYAEQWRQLRDVEGWNITSTWINGLLESPDDISELWLNISNEIKNSERLILYVEHDDFPLKGAFVEIGMALAYGVPIIIVAPDIVMEEPSFRPLGSWVNHPLVSFEPTMSSALVGAPKRV